MDFPRRAIILWRSKFSGMDTPDAKRLKALEAENAGLKKLLGGVACKTKSLVNVRLRQEILRWHVSARSPHTAV